jgi:cytochrome c-type biogenesis protein CcmF
MTALGRLFARNQRRYGGYIVHFGMVLIFVGISGTAFTLQNEFTLKPEENFGLGRYHIKFAGMTFGRDEAKEWMGSDLDVYLDGKLVQKLHPEKRLYTTHEQPTTEVALLSTWRDDLYVVLAGYDNEKGLATFSVYVNPLVRWLWIGGWVMALGTVLAVVPLSRQPQAPAAPTRKPSHRAASPQRRRAPRREQVLAA